MATPTTKMTPECWPAWIDSPRPLLWHFGARAEFPNSSPAASTAHGSGVTTGEGVAPAIPIDGQ